MQQRVYDQVCDGLTNKQIGEVLKISHNTVKRHLFYIFIKTGVKSRLQLGLLAMKEIGQE